MRCDSRNEEEEENTEALIRLRSLDNRQQFVSMQQSASRFVIRMRGEKLSQNQRRIRWKSTQAPDSKQTRMNRLIIEQTRKTFTLKRNKPLRIKETHIIISAPVIRLII